MKAPRGSTLEVPDFDEGLDGLSRRFQIILKSTAGPIEVRGKEPGGHAGARNRPRKDTCSFCGEEVVRMRGGALGGRSCEDVHVASAVSGRQPAAARAAHCGILASAFFGSQAKGLTARCSSLLPSLQLFFLSSEPRPPGEGAGGVSVTGGGAQLQARAQQVMIKDEVRFGGSCQARRSFSSNLGTPATLLLDCPPSRRTHSSPFFALAQVLPAPAAPGSPGGLPLFLPGWSPGAPGGKRVQPASPAGAYNVHSMRSPTSARVLNGTAGFQV